MSRGELVLRVQPRGEGATELLAPSIGIFIPNFTTGGLVGAGQSIGTIDVLGVRTALVVPDGVAGRAVERIGGSLTRVPVQFGDVLVVLSAASVIDEAAGGAAPRADAEGALSFDAPMSGRFYGRPSPSEPAFVGVGDSIVKGQTVGLLEVMKTFNRLVYQGDALPERVTVAEVVPSDGDDVVRGDPILLLAELQD